MQYLYIDYSQEAITGKTGCLVQRFFFSLSKTIFFYEVKVVHTKIIHRPSLRRRAFIVTKKFTETNPLDHLFIK